jgi:hypothetical protein
MKGLATVRNRIFVALGLASSAILAVPSVLLAPAAQASGRGGQPCTTTIQVANVFVNTTKTIDVVGKWTTQCTAIAADWSMQGGPSYGQYVGGWNFTAGTTTTDAYYNPTIDPLGSYEVLPAGAHDPGFNSVPQNTAYFSVKLSSTVTVSGHRSRGYVIIRAYVKRFSTSADSGLGGWTAWTNQPVKFSAFHNGWKSAGTKWTTSTGFTKYVKIYAPTKRSFRAFVAATGTVWGDTSKAFKS